MDLDGGFSLTIVGLISSLITYLVTGKSKRQKDTFEIKKDSQEYYITQNDELLKSLKEKNIEILELSNKILALETLNKRMTNKIEELTEITTKNSDEINQLKKALQEREN